MGKTIFTIIFFTAAYSICSAQVKIGANPVTVNPAAVLELSNDTTAAPSTWKGFIPAYVNFSNPVFTASSVWGISGTATQGTIVFNTADIYSNGFSGPGLYYWLRNRWAPLAFSLGDNIRNSLTASQVAYDTATADSWVKVTAAEYNNVLAIVSGAAKYGQPDSFMVTPTSTSWNGVGSFTIGGNPNAMKIPGSSYIIAWSVRSGNEPTNAAGSQLKVSVSQATGYKAYGDRLPDIGNITGFTLYYFVLKTPSTLTPPSPCYTAIYTNYSGFLASYNSPDVSERWNNGDSPNLPGTHASNSYSQVIATQQRQW
jgi:hypothetical protein